MLLEKLPAGLSHSVTNLQIVSEKLAVEMLGKVDRLLVLQVPAKPDRHRHFLARELHCGRRCATAAATEINELHL